MPTRHADVFFRRFLASPGTVGALFPTSRVTARLMANQVRPDATVLEIGAGTGALTQQILNRITDTRHLTSVEMDPILAKTFRKRFPQIALTVGDAEDVLRDGAGWDAVVSGIPFAIMPAEKRERMFRLITQRLRPGGVFVAFQYSLTSNKELKNHFRDVHVIFSPLNLPPAVVYVCRA